MSHFFQTSPHSNVSMLMQWPTEDLIPSPSEVRECFSLTSGISCLSIYQYKATYETCKLQDLILDVITLLEIRCKRILGSFILSVNTKTNFSDENVDGYLDK